MYVDVNIIIIIYICNAHKNVLIAYKKHSHLNIQKNSQYHLCVLYNIRTGMGVRGGDGCSGGEGGN